MRGSPGKSVCRRPRVGERFRVHPACERLAPTCVAYDPDTGEPFCVAEYLWGGTVGLVPVRLRACVNDRGERFVWCIGIGPPAPSCGGPNVELLMADTAKRTWCVPGAAWGSFETLAPGAIPEPAWEGFDVGGAIYEAFEGRSIDKADHPVLVGLRRGS